MIVSYEKHDLSIQKNILNLYAYTCRKLLFLFNRVYLEFSFYSCSRIAASIVTKRNIALLTIQNYLITLTFSTLAIS